MPCSRTTGAGDSPGARQDLVNRLQRNGIADVSGSRLTRSLYSSDASLYRVEPLAVVAPRSTDELEGALATAREFGVPVTPRGTGTSIAGNAVGPGLVVDTRRHLTRILELDTDTGTALVEPGVVHAALQRRAEAAGWRFGPDPATHDRCTIGGMVGNNACGARALGYGRTSDNTLGLDVVTGTGERFCIGDLAGPALPESVSTGLTRLADDHLALLRTTFGRFPRQISGYALEHLLPERGRDLARLLVGSEGTLAVTTRARVRLVRAPAARLLVVLGYPTMPDAADAVPALLRHGPVACEGLDRRIVDVVRARRGPAAVPDLPEGAAWLLVELAGDDRGALAQAASRLVADAGAQASRVVTDKDAAEAIWRIREAGAGLSARTPAGMPAHAGWEDAAVPPERLGDYLRAFDALLEHHGFTGLPYGHLGDGCLHIRIDVPLERPDGPAALRRFVTDAAVLAVAHGGSLTGEHGDGRARSELLDRMYPPEALALFAAVKHVFDPQALLNPGVIVAPAPLDAALRQPIPTRVLVPRHAAFALAEDGGDLARAVHRCTGVTACLTDRTAAGGVMCPSYQATGAEKDSTRGRARVLQDALAGHLGPRGLAADEVHEALDLCLGCKGCLGDCPTGTDVATYKSLALAERYRRRLRPRGHYTLGWLPAWTRWAGRVPGATGLVTRVAGNVRVGSLAARAAGLEPGRALPGLASRTFRSGFAQGGGLAEGTGAAGSAITLFVDSFTDALDPDVGHAATWVLQDAGYAVRLSPPGACCGLTWLTTGQLGTARRVASRTVRAMTRLGGESPVVVLEPSCASALRRDVPGIVAAELREQARTLARRVRSLAEVLQATSGWEPPDLNGLAVACQPHCHEHATGRLDAELGLLRRAGAHVDRVGGCCGMAGSFGLEPGHGEISRAIGRQRLVPAVARLDDTGEVVADGFSCRTQVVDLTNRRAVHLAQLLRRSARLGSRP